MGKLKNYPKAYEVVHYLVVGQAHMINSQEKSTPHMGWPMSSPNYGEPNWVILVIKFASSLSNLEIEPLIMDKVMHGSLTPI